MTASDSGTSMAAVAKVSRATTSWRPKRCLAADAVPGNSTPIYTPVIPVVFTNDNTNEWVSSRVL
jgi:hypothetical protein